MNGEGIKEVARLAQVPKVEEIAGLRHLLLPAGEGGYEVRTPDQPDPPHNSYGLSTLTGLVGYLSENPDTHVLTNLIVHVATPTKAVAYLPLKRAGRFATRQLVASADCAALLGEGYKFGQWLDVESFVIALQVLFEPTEEWARLLSVVGNIKEEKVRETGDDGIAQSVVARAGVALGKDVKIPNPVTLQPYRTFREVSQPSSKFVLRARAGVGDGALPSLALFEADGGLWKLRAMESTKAYLDTELVDSGIVVLA